MVLELGVLEILGLNGRPVQLSLNFATIYWVKFSLIIVSFCILRLVLIPHDVKTKKKYKTLSVSLSKGLLFSTIILYGPVMRDGEYHLLPLAFCTITCHQGLGILYCKRFMRGLDVCEKKCLEEKIIPECVLLNGGYFSGGKHLNSIAHENGFNTAILPDPLHAGYSKMQKIAINPYPTQMGIKNMAPKGNISQNNMTILLEKIKESIRREKESEIAANQVNTPQDEGF